MKKIAIITGSAGGIGLIIAKKFLANGYSVVFSDINKEGLEKAINEEKQKGFDCIGIKCDVTKEEEIKNLISQAMEHYGRIDVLINNAGLQHVANIEDFPTDKFEFMIKIMLTAAFMGTKYVFPIMKNQKFGRIINMASINGVIGFAGKSAYNSAKHGLIGLTKVVALEGATYGITANAICPGYVDTPLVRGQMADLAKTRGVSVEKVLDEVLFPLIPQKTLIDINDIAELALFVASEHAKNITGQSMIIDGGYTVQ
ncbi:3-hydroxybutyrate dehydrogenase [Helicobacter sp. 12S02232-10]|uniref:3-hydroxybutyrate dehydrogenase n=1 Tax=Helicobacter sp. 12S02232-10 TaxID=1476197 RepID=UPI000BA5B0A9|nr:3-hydroxybutyrate dehydrogenase [Helicobacter sp. 12S02232-10]PAF49942.1 3-hydroxybutyrate dehydrogenase [Helicobacter sp. 12S02232-10]